MLTECQIKNIVDKYKKEFPKYGLGIAHKKLTEYSYRINIETIETSRYTVNGKSATFGKNVVFDNNFEISGFEYEEVKMLDNMIMEAVEDLISITKHYEQTKTN